MRRKPLFPPPQDPASGKRLANKGRQSRSVLTINGRVRLWRRWWHASSTGSVAPADEVLDRCGTTITPGVCELAARENLSATSFDKAAANLRRTAQLSISGEQLRLVVEAAGRRVLAAQQAGSIATAWKAGDCRVQGTPEVTRVYAGCDGVMVPTITEAEKQKRRQKTLAKRRRGGKKRKPLPPRRRGADRNWKEFKVVYFYSEDMRRQHVAFTANNHEAAGRLMRREANRLQFASAGERVAVVDGAPWIREQMQFHLAELDGLGLDFYHLSENVHRARRKVFGEETPEGHAWAGELMHVFKHEGYGAAWQRLVQWRAKLKDTKCQEAADRLLNYVAQRREMIRYPAFREKGWQIGSGPTESQCKLCTKRLKGYGRRWDRPNAAAVAALDTLDRSGQWQSYWPTPAAAST
jgi:hypothetical protein